MPFFFSYVCDLLQRLEDNRVARSGLRTNAAIIQEWFRGHHGLLYRDDHSSAPLLSALLPEKRTDRVYFIREKKLQTIVGRALGLGRSRIAELGRWSSPEARADLADCVEGILKQTPNPVSPTHRPVTVEEIDELLHSVAAACRFSSPAVRSSAENRSADQELSLGDLYQRLTARDAKWLTRLILKNYEPVVLDQRVVCAGYHPLLPAILKVQDDLAVAGRILDTLKRDRTVTGRSELAEYLKPTLGVKIGRQTWLKGRSIKHCLSMVQGRISCEEKMDGEYCQIHIDLSKGRDCIQIFSKSGKDSTRDRIALHESIRTSLQLGQPSCPLKHSCILEGELVVYSGKTHKILDFHKIRKHVSRSGSFLGTDKDSQAHPWEHLMIVYYDLLMVDNESLLAVKHSERFQRLKSLITLIPGRSSLVKRELIDCGRRSAVSDLRRAFAKCITARGEGLVLKADDPYFDFGTLRRPYSCCAIKLKKEYIGRFGDIGDFAVVGARFDAAKARTYNIPRLKWTHFYVGCLENKDEVQRFGKQPRFVVTNVVELNATQLAAFVSSVNPEAVRPEDNTAVSLRIEPGVDGGKRPSVIFPTPPVFDLRCFSFDKEGNTGFWSPRFASVSKIHTDRTYHDTISFAELQEMATKEREAPPPEDSQELLGWIAALENSESRTAVDTASQSTISTVAESATQSTQPMEPAASSRIADQAGATLGRKRPLESSTQSSIPDRSKIQRRSSDQVASATPLPDNNGIGPSVRGREPSVGSQTTLSQRTAATLPMLRPSRRTAATLPMLRPSSAGSVQQAGSHSKRDDARPPLQASVSFPSMMSQAFSAASRTGQTEKGSVSSHGAGHQRSDKPIDSGTVKPTDIATVNATDNSAAKATDNVTDHAADKATDNASANGINNTTADASVNVADEAAENTAAKCQFLSDMCKFRTYSILLSPCIANFPWVTDDLLGGHGVTEFLRDPKEWLSTQGATTGPDGTTVPASSCTCSASTGTPRRTKIILIDRRREEASKAFLQLVEAAQLKRRNGEREYVPFYDWRVLEAIRDEERKYHNNKWKPGREFELNYAAGIWRRFWVGLA